MLQYPQKAMRGQCSQHGEMVEIVERYDSLISKDKAKATNLKAKP